MTNTTRHSTPKQPQLDAVTRLGAAFLLSGMSLWRRYCAIGAKQLTLAMAAALQSRDDGASLQVLLDGFKRYWMEMATVVPVAAEQFATTLDDVDDLVLPQATARQQRSYLIQDKPVMLPTRVHDASQGLAVFSVAADTAQGVLDELTPGEQEQPLFTVLRLDGKHAALAIFIVDYRVSDLGAYHELGVALFVRPAQRPAAMPGMYVIELPVNGEFTRKAGEKIWGYPKKVEDLTLNYQTDRVDCIFCRRGQAASRAVMTLSFPRMGKDSSTAIPFYSYTLKEGRPHLTIFTRSGQGEGVQVGAGAFTLDLGATDDPLVKTLTRLGLPKPPIMHGWSEHMSGEFGIPRPLV